MPDNQSEKDNTKQDMLKILRSSSAAAPTNDDRPHWCADCRAAGKKMRNGPCPGHAKSGGGDSGGGDQAGSVDEEIDSTNTPIVHGSVAEKIFELVCKPSNNNNAATKKAEEEKYLEEKLDAKFNPSIIAELMRANLLSINNKVAMGMLLIELHPQFFDQKFLTPAVKIELAKFIQAIENELTDFVAKNGILVNGVKKDIEMDMSSGAIKSFSLTFANRHLYEKFYNQLDKNVFSVIAKAEKEDVRKDEKARENIFHPKPTSTKLERK